MTLQARYVYTNLFARNWRPLAAFYQDIFGCIPVPPERDLKNPSLEAGTGIPGIHLQGMHLRLPGYDDSGPTLEIFTYSPQADPPQIRLNRPGFGHIAFLVEDVVAARDLVLYNGGTSVGEVVKLTIANGDRVTWCYGKDPEGNGIELQSWKYQGENDVE